MNQRKFQCVNKTDKFCYICGYYKLCDFKTINSQICDMYKDCFDLQLNDHEKDWAPSKICKWCLMCLKKGKFTFKVPTIWREPASHPDKCFFCSINLVGFNKKNLKSIKYPLLEACIRPADFEGEEYDPVELNVTTSTGSSVANDDEIVDPSFVEERNTKITTAQLNDMARNLHLSKNSSILYAQMLKETNSLCPETTTSHFRNRDELF
jgi:hypothetical protein